MALKVTKYMFFKQTSHYFLPDFIKCFVDLYTCLLQAIQVSGTTFIMCGDPGGIPATLLLIRANLPQVFLFGDFFFF